MGNRKEYYSLQHGTVTYDPDLLDIEDIKEMDNLATNRQVDCREGYNPTRGDDIGRLQRVINHAERVSLVYDPSDLYMNVGIDPVEKPLRYLNTMAGRAGWKITLSSRDRLNKSKFKATYKPPVESIESIIIYYNKEDALDYAYFEPFIIQFLDINKKLMDSAVEI